MNINEKHVTNLRDGVNKKNKITIIQVKVYYPSRVDT